MCGYSLDLTLDHIVALANGGTSDESNLRTLCRYCNSTKNHDDPSDETTLWRSARSKHLLWVPSIIGIYGSFVRGRFDEDEYSSSPHVEARTCTGP